MAKVHELLEAAPREITIPQLAKILPEQFVVGGGYYAERKYVKVGKMAYRISRFMAETPTATLFISKRKQLSLAPAPSGALWQVELEEGLPVERSLTWDERSKFVFGKENLTDLKALRQFVLTAISAAQPLEESVEEDSFEIQLLRDALKAGKPVFVAFPKHVPGSVTYGREVRDVLDFHEVLGLRDGGVFRNTAYGSVAKKDIGKPYITLETSLVHSVYSKHPNYKRQPPKDFRGSIASDQLILVNDDDAANFSITKAKIFKNLPEMLVIALERGQKFPVEKTLELIKQHKPI